MERSRQDRTVVAYQIILLFLRHTNKRHCYWEYSNGLYCGTSGTDSNHYIFFLATTIGWVKNYHDDGRRRAGISESLLHVSTNRQPTKTTTDRGSPIGVDACLGTLCLDHFSFSLSDCTNNSNREEAICVSSDNP